MTYKEISARLQQACPQVRGLSEKSVRHFCKENWIEKMNDAEVDDVIAEVHDVIAEVVKEVCNVSYI